MSSNEKLTSSMMSMILSSEYCPSTKNAPLLRINERERFSASSFVPNDTHSSSAKSGFSYFASAIADALSLLSSISTAEANFSGETILSVISGMIISAGDAVSTAPSTNVILTVSFSSDTALRMLLAIFSSSPV